MQDSWRKHFRVGVIQFMMFPDSPGNDARTIETARQVFLDDFFGTLAVGRMSDEAMKAVKGMATDAHASLAISAAPFILGNKLNLANIDETGRRAAVQALKKSVDDAYFLGSPMLEVLDGGQSYPGPEKEQQAVDQLVSSLKELCQYADDTANGRTPLWIVLETFDRAIDKKSLVGPSGIAVDVAKRVREQHPRFGLTIDMGHLPLIGERYIDSLRTTSDYIVHAHLGSCIKDDPAQAFYGDSHPAFGLEGGVADIAELTEFFAALQEIGYFEKQLPTGRPWVTFEVKPQPGQLPELVMANCKRVLKEAWANL